MNTTQFPAGILKACRVITVVLGACFLIIGILTVLNSVAWTIQSKTLGYQALLYGALNFVFSYGLIQKQSWAFTISICNLAFSIISIGDSLLVAKTEVHTYSIVLLGINLVLCASLYAMRKTLSGTFFAVGPLSLFFIARLFPTIMRMM
jgi:hypothetical protein